MDEAVQLFTPDRFSVSTLGFSSPSSDLRKAADRVLRVHYFGDQDEPFQIDQLGGFNVNSMNFRVVRGADQFLLKRTGPNCQREAFERQLRVANLLAERHYPVAVNLKSRASELLPVDTDGVAWQMSTFIEGTYYSGAEEEVRELGAAIGALHQGLSSVSEGWTKDAFPYEEIRDAHDALMRERNSLINWFPATEATLLHRHLDLLSESYAFLVRHVRAIEALPTALCHIDLHPHNLLMRSGRVVAFVDMESLQLARVAVATGFAGLKLIRQCGVHSGGSSAVANRCGRLFVEGLRSTNCLSNDDVALIGACALLEVFRRIAIIVRLNMHQSDTKWNSVLNMHLLALREIPIIFG